MFFEIIYRCGINQQNVGIENEELAVSLAQRVRPGLCINSRIIQYCYKSKNFYRFESILLDRLVLLLFFKYFDGLLDTDHVRIHLEGFFHVLDCLLAVLQSHVNHTLA